MEITDFALARHMLSGSRMSEDFRRQPDGVPHEIVCRTACAALMLAVAGLAMLVAFGATGTILVAAFAIPIMVVALDHKSELERDRLSP